MDRSMRVVVALLLVVSVTDTFIPGTDGPISHQAGLEGGNTTLFCDSTPETADDQLVLLVWYKNNAPIYSYDTREDKEWSNDTFNTSGRVYMNRRVQPTALIISQLTEADQALYHCRVDFFLSPTRNLGVNLSIIVLPSEPFFLDELGNKVGSKIGPFHEGDTLVLSCLVIGGRPPPHISWYNGATLVDATDGDSDIPAVRENTLYLPLTRDTAHALSCSATNTDLASPRVTTAELELYLPAYNVSIRWLKGLVEGALQTGRAATAECSSYGAVPGAELSWWLGHQHLTHRSNQTYDGVTGATVSWLQLTAAAVDDGSALACVATNTAMAPSRGSLSHVTRLNVTYSPIVKVVLPEKDDGGILTELYTLTLLCEVKANPPAVKFLWYFNGVEIKQGNFWGEDVHNRSLVVVEVSRHHMGRYSCAATNAVGETTSEPINITIHYPPECSKQGVTLEGEALRCNVIAMPVPDTYFWHIQTSESDTQAVTTGSHTLLLNQLTGPLTEPLRVSCEAANGVTSQEKACERTFSLRHLRPPPPQQCDLVLEQGEFQMRCIPVENATQYELSVWLMSSTNSSLVLSERRAMWRGGAVGGKGWLVRGSAGVLQAGDEAGAAACNRYGCSAHTMLRPAGTLLSAQHNWWEFLLDRDMGWALCGVLLCAAFVVTTCVAVRRARRVRSHKPPPPVIQLLQLDERTKEYIESLQDHRVRASCSLRSCSSGYSEGSALDAPPVDRRRKPAQERWDWEPPPDVTLTLHKESAV